MTLYEEVRTLLRESEFKPRKRLGQNFLIHERVIASILRLLDLGPTDEVLEIGPGLGFLTRELVARASRVTAVEVDDLLVERLKRSPLGSQPRLRLIHEDILRVALDDLLPATKIKLVGNLPYSISTAVLLRLMEARAHFSFLVLMLQKEVAERIASGPGSKAYGRLSVWCQIHGRIAEKVNVAPEAFFPRPKVRSVVLKIELFSEPRLAPDDLPVLRGLLRAAFGHRRKMLANTLSAGLHRPREEIEDFLTRRDIDPARRGETLTADDFIRLARAAKDRWPAALARDA